MKLITKINPRIRFAAEAADAALASKAEQTAQSLWDQGESFIISSNVMDSMLPQQRMEDSEEEISAAVESLETSLAWIAIDGSIRSMSRESVIQMLSSILDMDSCGSLTLYGQHVDVDCVIRRWNDQHPSEKPITRTPGFEK